MPQLTRISSNNTTIATEPDGTIAVTLHRTVIFRRHPDGSLTLNSNGWRTATTRNRMTQCFRQLTDSRYAVGQRKGAWHISERDPANSYALVREIPFADGMRLP